MLARIPYKWLVAGIYVLGLFMSLLDLTITNVALPVMAREFGASTSLITWVATSYLLSVAVCIPISGWLSDRFGTKRAFGFALAIFTIGSLLCGLADNLNLLIFFRVLQGIGGGLLTPVGAAMVFRAFPLEERARVAAITTMPAVLAPATGPVVGGYLVQYHSWHWIFLINVPLGLLGLFLAARGLREYRVVGTARLDLPGFILATGGLAATVYALGEVGERGLGDPRVLGLGLVGLGALIAFVLVELRVAAPMIDVRLYRDRLFAVGSVVLFMVNAGFFGISFLLPQFLQGVRGLNAFQSGLATFPTAIGIIISAPLVARLYPLVGPRRLVMVGATLAACAAFGLRQIDLATNLWQIRLQVLPLGFAFGLVFIPLQTASFAGISAAMTGRATAAYNAVRQIATSFGFAILATILSSRLITHGAAMPALASGDNPAGAVAAFHDTFLAAMCLDLAALAAATLISDRLAARTMVHKPAPPAPSAEPQVAAAA